jgi:hypothetical protein
LGPRVSDQRLEDLSTDEFLDRERAPELVAARPARTDRLQLDLFSQQLPEHLSRLDGLPTEQRCHVAGARLKPALELSGVDGGDPRDHVELFQFRLKCGLPGFVRPEASSDLVGRPGAVR